jgi:aminopeptidase N
MRTVLFAIMVSLAALPVAAQVPHYAVKLTPDFDRQLLKGEETIEFQHGPGAARFRKKPGINIASAAIAGGEVTVEDESVTARLSGDGARKLQVTYSVSTARTLRWLPDGTGLFTVFDCGAWMVCNPSPNHRITASIEFVLPVSSRLRAIGPGRLAKRWQDDEGDHFVFEQNNPVQTYLLSFAVAALEPITKDGFTVYAGEGGHEKLFEDTLDAYEFLRAKAGVDPINPHYTQVFLPRTPVAQESSGLALMSEDHLTQLETEDAVGTMVHELAHQWWGALVGIRSWSDFWLNEGMAEFITDAYIEHRSGRVDDERAIERLEKRFAKLRTEGKDRPLHWEEWRDAREALGRIPYVKGSLFLHRLRTRLGDDAFWRGLALYTSRNANRLVDTEDFKSAMEEASGSNLTQLFEDEVYN